MEQSPIVLKNAVISIKKIRELFKTMATGPENPREPRSNISWSA